MNLLDQINKESFQRFKLRIGKEIKYLFFLLLKVGDIILIRNICICYNFQLSGRYCLIFEIKQALHL